MLPQVPVAGPRGFLVAFWVTRGADVQAGRSEEVRGRSDLCLLWKDHRDTLENPVGAGRGENRGKKEEK